MIYAKKLEILAGPNGCGKTTLSEYLIDEGRLLNFVNADIIEKGLIHQTLRVEKLQMEKFYFFAYTIR